MDNTLLYCMIVIICLIIFIYFKGKDDLIRYMNIILTVIFAGLILVNGLVAMPDIYKKLTYERDKVKFVQADKDLEERPNLYYLIFDEYAGFNGISNIYGYDNREFINFLTEKQFNISYTSESESIATEIEIPRTFSLGLQEIDISLPIEKNLENPYLYQFLRQRGYGIRAVSYQDVIDTLNVDTGFTIDDVDVTQRIDVLIANKSILKKFYNETYMQEAYEVFANDPFDSYADNLLRTVEEYKSYCTKGTKGVMNLAYFSFPHDPFVFDENGNRTEPLQFNNWVDKSYYLGQYKYANTIILDIVNTILESDPDGIIILQSDHGVRYAGKVKEMDSSVDYEALEPLQHNIINCVYYQGKVMDIEGVSASDTLNIVLNSMFQSKLPLSKEN